MTSLLWFGILLLFTPRVQAENFYSPLLCSVEEAYLKVQNNKTETQSFWFQSLGAYPFSESQVDVKARGNLTLPLQEYLHNNESAMALKSQTNSLTFKTFCKTTQDLSPVGSATSPWKKLELPSQVLQLQLHLANLSQQPNSVEISYESLEGLRHSQSVLLSEDFRTLTLALELPFDATTTTVKVHGQGRWSGKAISSQNEEFPFVEETVILENPSTPSVRYFLFESQDHALESHPGSFVVPLENPKLIAESLQQIANPAQARLLVARIGKAQNNLNRDFSSPVKSPWSWQVVEAQNYADFAHISCDGTPALVEERLNSWLQETGGTICFWNYRVVRELTLRELTQQFTQQPLGTKDGSLPLARGFLPRTRLQSSLYSD